MHGLTFLYEDFNFYFTFQNYLQIFSCISRRLNHHNAFSLPKMMLECEAAYRTHTVTDNVVVTNNFDWDEYLNDISIHSSRLQGINKVKIYIGKPMLSMKQNVEMFVYK